MKRNMEFNDTHTKKQRIINEPTINEPTINEINSILQMEVEYFSKLAEYLFLYALKMIKSCNFSLLTEITSQISQILSHMKYIKIHMFYDNHQYDNIIQHCKDVDLLNYLLLTHIEVKKYKNCNSAYARNALSLMKTEFSIRIEENIKMNLKNIYQNC